jgi:hypothetical protein
MRSFLLLLILSIIYLNNVSGLTLGEPKITVATKYDTKFTIPQTATNMVSILQNNNNIATVPHNFLNTMAKEIMLIAYNNDMTDISIQHKTWQFTIRNDIGMIQVFSINALITNHENSQEHNLKQVHITGYLASISVSIPKVYEQKQVCARTGRRRYGVAGPRANVCHTHNVERGLHNNEIDLIYSTLISGYDKAQVLLLAN